MRVLTRDDLDGLTCCALISLHEEVDELRLTHPQELADGHMDMHEGDIIANLPFRQGCSLWFDHHLHSAGKPPRHLYEGAFGQAPSATRLVYEYYGGRATMPQFDSLVRCTAT